jgi:archaellum component FlaC
MAKATLTQRVEALEHKVSGLATLPARVGAVERELKDFRADVDAEFGRVHAEFGKVHTALAGVRDEVTGVRGELAGVRDEVTVVRGELTGLRDEVTGVRGELAGVRDEFAGVRDEFVGVRDEFATVRSEIRQGDEETRRYMRVLYEELVERIKIMGEGIEELRRRS